MTIHFFLFVVMVMSLIIVPGPDMLYVVGRSILRGRAAAWYAALGVSFGYMVFTILVAAGVGLIFERSPLLFLSLKIAGLVYLGYLAYRLFSADGEVEMTGEPTENARARSLRADFVFGILTSTLNPKGILFYFSILPQFFVTGTSPLWAQAMLYGLTTSILCLLMYYAAGLGAIYGASRWQMTPSRRRSVSRISGSVLLAIIGVLVITTELPVK